MGHQAGSGMELSQPRQDRHALMPSSFTHNSCVQGTAATVTQQGWAHVFADVHAQQIPKLRRFRRKCQATEHPHDGCDLPRVELIDLEVLCTAHLDHRHQLLQNRVQRLRVRPAEARPPLPDDVCGVGNVQHGVLPCPQLLHDVRKRRRRKRRPEHALRLERLHDV